ncbi:metallophosphoesterase [Allobaculum fili]|uniref:metallophosphoesterase n=1 Tax=Allobaculum fili TaxID=2834460 RepID=UPI001E3EE04C|nr:hypothetical protein [Allobaculum fili]
MARRTAHRVHSRKRRQPLWLTISMWVIGIAVFCMTCLTLTLYNGIFVAPYQVHSNFSQIRSTKIPASLNQLSIVYLSDIEYGENFPVEKGDKLFDEIASLDPDVLLIGGDLFSKNAEVSGEMRDQMVNWISRVEAPSGKFAVYGEQDQTSMNRLLEVNDVYGRSQVEMLDNASVLLSNGSGSGIRLAGLGLQPDPEAIASTIPGDTYCLMLSHFPDNLLAVQNSSLRPDLALCGNSHGSQVKWPIFGNYRTVEGSTQINRSKSQKLSFPYTISSGIGCVDVPAKINSPVEYSYFTLVSGSKADDNAPAQAPLLTSSLQSDASSQTDAPAEDAQSGTDQPMEGETPSAETEMPVENPEAAPAEN